MKTLLSTLGILNFAFQITFAQTLNIDVTNSRINWTGHAEIGSYSPAGALKFKTGKITLKDNKVNAAQLTIDMKSMQQDNATLLEHLKSDDFFDVEKYPVSTVTINKIINGTASGILTIKGKTLPFICPLSIINDKGRMTVSGTCNIDRTKYGIIYNSGSFFSGLGDKAIRNTFDVAFTIVASN